MTAPLFDLSATAGPHLVGTRCTACASVSFPPRPICWRCGGEAMERQPIGRHGTIQSSTVVHHAPARFVAPYVLALVALDEGPIVFAPIVGAVTDAAALSPGRRVELMIAPARAGGAAVYQFRPLDAGTG